MRPIFYRILAVLFLMPVMLHAQEKPLRSATDENVLKEIQETEKLAPGAGIEKGT
ncbi:MAG: hypothetical protein JST39_09130, partial [Bacteroidetes bacterium]|nr:hypothetical protein [Bacteroidota bacterium]